MSNDDVAAGTRDADEAAPTDATPPDAATAQPASTASPEAGPIIVFDGTCVLCSRWIRFLLRFDRQTRFRFAAMQTSTGRALLAAHGLDPDDPASFLLVEHGRAVTDTDAIARVLVSLGLPWRIAAFAVRALPRRLRDATYRVVARNRYRWFGRHASCVVPPLEQRVRFFD